jgi:hypothetical protein
MQGKFYASFLTQVQGGPNGPASSTKEAEWIN